MRRLLSPLLLALTLAGSPSSAAPEPPVERQVRLTRRAPGAAHRPVHAATIVVDLDALTQETRTVLDHRGQTLTVQGVPLSSLLAKAPKDRVVDAARLRFKNGTEVLLPLSRAPMLDVFIARRFKHSDQAAFTTDFDPVPLGEASWRSPRSLVFSGNRVFATAPAEPPQGRGFVPWGFVDTLVEVELVQEAAWQGVFDVTPETRRGLEVWRARCQTCHGARGAGASFGWDFVQPLPLSTWRTPDGLFSHVRSHKLEGPSSGSRCRPSPTSPARRPTPCTPG